MDGEPPAAHDTGRTEALLGPSFGQRRTSFVWRKVTSASLYWLKGSAKTDSHLRTSAILVVYLIFLSKALEEALA
jgi:hypothetical protein